MASAASLPKGLHHLEVTAPHKFVSRYSPRVVPTKSFVQPHDRIRRWNIRQGDYVRLLVGKPEDKYINGKDARDGWKVHQVTGLDMERNKLLLNGVTYKKSNPIANELPPDASEQEKQEFENQRNFLNISRPVHYSNVGLCIDQRARSEGGDVFATRLTTSPPIYNKIHRQFTYRRFAARAEGENLEGYETEDVGVFATTNRGEKRERRLIGMNWPAFERREVVDASNVDASPEAVQEESVRLTPIRDIWNQPDSVPLATSSRAPTKTLPRLIADRYIDQINGTEDASAAEGSEGVAGTGVPTEEVDTMMPLYLSEELSPRFSRSKATKGWNLRQAQLQAEKTSHAQSTVRTWTSSGKDKNLSPILSQLGYEGHKIRPRTSTEVRSSAEKEFENAVFERKRIARMAKRAGGRWVHGGGEGEGGEGKWKVERDEGEVRREEKREERKRRKAMFLRLNRLNV